MNKDSLIWWDWVGRHTTQIQSATIEHLKLTVIAVGAGFVISLALAAISLRFRRTYAPIAGFAGILYTVPSLALFALLLPITGFTTLTAEVGLVTYTLAIFVRNFVEGVDSVAPDVIDAANGMGFRPLRRFAAVDLPLALPAIVAGLRIATVSTVGLVTVTGLIGQGGYGAFIQSGLARNFSTEIMVGAALSVLLAVGLDIVLVGIERGMTPWRRGRR